MSLLYYSKERELFPKEFEEHITDGVAQLFFERIKAHYKFRHGLEFGYRRGLCNLYRVSLPHNPPLAFLIHECCHAIQFKKWGFNRNGERAHTKKHTILMRRMFLYVQNHRAYWTDLDKAQAERRRLSYQNKLNKAQELRSFKDSHQGKIENLRKREKSALTRIKRGNSILKGIRRKIKYYEKRQEEQTKGGVVVKLCPQELLPVPPCPVHPMIMTLGALQ